MVNDQVILINPHVQKKLCVLLVINALFLAAIYYLPQLDSDLFGWVSSLTFYGLYALIFTVSLLLNLVNKGKKIIFSVRDQCVYSHTILSRKKLMAFNAIGAIKPYETGYGTTYFGLFDKANLFGRNPVRISPNYSPGPNDVRLYAEFDRTVLPQLQSMIGSTARDRLPNNLITNTSMLAFYDKLQDTYRLKHTYHRDVTSYGIILILLGVSLLILVTPTLRLHYINFGIGTGVGAGIMAFLLTETKSFQNGNLVSEYTNGIFQKTYPLSQFGTFHLVHRKHNFIYVGTDVNMIINDKVIFLCQMRKTQQIEKLLDETNFIIDQQLAHNRQ